MNRWYDRSTKAAGKESFKERREAFGSMSRDFEAIAIQPAKRQSSEFLSWIWNELGIGDLVGEVPYPRTTREAGNLIITVLLPAVSRASSQCDIAVMQLRMSKVMMALAGYRAEVGSYPESLAKLCPKYFETAPEDMFTAEPIDYRNVEDGYRLYSAGPYADQGYGEIEIRVPPVKEVETLEEAPGRPGMRGRPPRPGMRRKSRRPRRRLLGEIMTGTVIGKILAEHLVEGKLEAGTDIAIRIDQTLTQDVTGTMAYLELEAMRVERVSVGLAVSYVDHNTAQFGPNNQNDHRYLQNMAAKLGVKFSRAGNGICHQVHLERFGVPGKTLLGSDSHTPTAGGIGAMGIGAGGLDVALAMAGEPFRMICPAVMGIELIGALSEWVTAKDVILKVLSILSTVGNTGTAVEYFGAGVASLNVPQRACITNMGAELGVTSSVFGADDKTREFLVGQDREKDYVELKADKDAAYDRVIEIDLSQLEPMIACPSSPDNIKKVSELAGTAVGQVFLGSCTNSSYQDLTRAARILKGKTVDANVSMAVSPGSRQVYEMIAANGALADLIASGCRILESACGPCIGVGFSPGSGVVSLRSNNRNFAGRSGTVGDQVYLASPEVLCTSALKGCISDPRELEMDYPQIDWPKKFLIDDRMIIEPEADGSEVDILRAETIGEPPKLDALVDELRGEVLLKLGDKITTDHISPAGQHLKWRSNIGEYAKVAFEAFNEEGQESFACRALKLKESGKCGFIVAGKSYGQGSSREHAAICPRYLGVRMVIAENFERIHSDNLINWGIIPVKLADAGDGGKFDPEDELTIEAVRGAVKDAKQMTVRNLSKGCNVRVNLELSTRQRKILLVGGRLNYSK